LWAATFLGWNIALFCGKASFALSPSGILWLIGQASFFPFYNPDQLRDLGIGGMNGSLWTIPVELQLYILIPIASSLIFALTKQTRRLISFLVLALVCLLSFYLQYILMSMNLFGDGQAPGQGLIFSSL